MSFIAAGVDVCFIVVIVDAHVTEPKECLETLKGYDYKGQPKRNRIRQDMPGHGRPKRFSTTIQVSPSLYNANM